MEIEIKELVETMIKGMDLKKMVRCEIREIIKDLVIEEVKNVVKKIAGRITSHEVKKVMSGYIIKSDGWYAEKSITFEQFFKNAVKDNVFKNYNMERMVKEEIEKQAKELIKNNTDLIKNILQQNLDKLKF